jgi:hypothetical protein
MGAVTLTWLGWLAGGMVLLAAGFVAVVVPRRRADALIRRTAWSAARAAIDTASVSRDACAVVVAEADQLLARAELIAARRGGRDAADTAADCARRADRLWREAARG